MKTFAGDAIERFSRMVTRHSELREAMREAIRLGNQPHYGDNSAALDHYGEAMDKLKAALESDEKESTA